MAFTSVEKGIGSTVIAVGSPRVREDINAWCGAYVVPPGKVVKATPQSTDPDLAKELKTFTDLRLREWGVRSSD